MSIKHKHGNFLPVIAIFFCLSIFIQSYFLERENFSAFIACMAIASCSYLLILRNAEAYHERSIFLLCVLLHLLPFFSTPPLSNDVYRFIWDGELLHRGINPYDFRPRELIASEAFIGNPYFEALYDKMGLLSQGNYSCYPVINQAYFYLSTAFSDQVYINILIMRFGMLLTLYLSFVGLNRLLKLAALPLGKKWIYLLNPLLIIEVSQNLHFEGVMISFILMGVYYLSQQRLFYGALFLSLAIQVKLIPLLMLPFLLRWIGWKKSLFTWSYVMLIVTGLSFILINSENYLNFLESINLYFGKFEFNSFILHWYVEYGEWRYGYNRIQSFGPYLSRLACKIIILLAWFGDNFDLKKMFTRLFFAFFAYYLFATTVHPWYLLTPLVFGIFTSYRFVMIWSLLVFLSYLFYANFSETTIRLVMFIEYAVVFAVLGYELIQKNWILPSFNTKD